jgi:hypothetical protein
MESKKSAYLIVVIFGFGCLVLSLMQLLSTSKLKSQAIRTESTVLDSKSIKSGSSWKKEITVSYISAEGKLDTAKALGKNNLSLSTGEKVQIYYYPSNPHWAAFGIVTNNYIGILLGGLIFIYGLSNYRKEVIKEKVRKTNSKQI